MVKAIFWDRDGVLVKLLDRGARGLTPPWFSEEFELLPDVRLAMGRAREAGYLNFVISNQPDIRSGELDFETLGEFNKIMLDTLPIDEIITCHDRGTWNYKPNPGMLLQLQQTHQIIMARSWMIGDTWKDAVAASLAKVRYIHIGKEDPIAPPYYKSPDVGFAVDLLLDHDHLWIVA